MASGVCGITEDFKAYVKALTGSTNSFVYGTLVSFYLTREGPWAPSSKKKVRSYRITAVTWVVICISQNFDAFGPKKKSLTQDFEKFGFTS